MLLINTALTISKLSRLDKRIRSLYEQGIFKRHTGLQLTRWLWWIVSMTVVNVATASEPHVSQGTGVLNSIVHDISCNSLPVPFEGCSASFTDIDFDVNDGFTEPHGRVSAFVSNNLCRVNGSNGAEVGINVTAGRPLSEFTYTTSSTSQQFLSNCPELALQYVPVRDARGNYWVIFTTAGTSTFKFSPIDGSKPWMACVGTDLFDPDLGCRRPSPAHAYINLDTTNGSTPEPIDCSYDSDWGRMVVDDVNELLYICTQSGWVSK